MENWEYLFVKCVDICVEDWRPRFINGRMVKNWQEGPTIIEYCREAGIRGWELVSFSPGESGLSMVFKRRVALALQRETVQPHAVAA
jgi:hypothetical protein